MQPSCQRGKKITPAKSSQTTFQKLGNVVTEISYMLFSVPVSGFRRIQLYLWGGPSNSSQTSLNRDSKPELKKKVHITEPNKSWKLTMLNKLESKEPGPAPCTREGMKVHQRWNYFIVKKKDMAVICKLRTVTTNLLEIDTARTLSARSSTLYQTPMRRMTTTGSEKRD